VPLYFELMKRIRFSMLLASAALMAAAVSLLAQSPSWPQGAQAGAGAMAAQAASPPAPAPEETEVWEPFPRW